MTLGDRGQGWVDETTVQIDKRVVRALSQREHATD